jgi:hypothetical protein
LHACRIKTASSLNQQHHKLRVRIRQPWINVNEHVVDPL